MSRVAIIGAGDLGGACAQAIAARDRVAEVLLIDTASTVAAGKALDILQAGAIEGRRCRLRATDDLTAVTGVAACVIADRAGTPSSEWHGDDGLAMLRRLLPYLSGAPLVFCGASQANLMLLAARELGVARDRLIGSAPDAHASAIRGIVALEAQCSPDEISLAVLGAPPDPSTQDRASGDVGGFVVPWGEASIGGYALDRVLTQAQVARLQARAARLWPAGPYTLGLAAARCAEAVCTSSRRSFSVLTLLGGEFGIRNRIGALPVLLASGGIAHVRVPSLNTRERVQLETALHP